MQPYVVLAINLEVWARSDAWEGEPGVLHGFHGADYLDGAQYEGVLAGPERVQALGHRVAFGSKPMKNGPVSLGYGLLEARGGVRIHISISGEFEKRACISTNDTTRTL
eukprot:885831-Rhodomonas_salina.2